MTKNQEKEKIKSHSVEEILNKSMSSSIWKDLPPEVLEIVLACLPAHVLCRFRLVCKEWNHFISHPSFAMLCALSPGKASSIFISPKVVRKAMTASSEWHVLDPTEKRSYKLSDSFIMDYYCSRNKELRNPWLYKYTLAADRELIYTIYLPSFWSTTGMHIVCNPMSKSFHEIPELPGICHNIVVMSVDNATKTYKIVCVEMGQGSQNLFLYESATSMWKLCELPGIGLAAYSSIFMKGIFYTLFVDFTDIPFAYELYTVVLYSCDLVTGAWCKINVDFPPLSIVENLQLVVSLGHLYMVRFTRCRTQMVRLSIWKIVLETKEVVQVGKNRILSKMFHPSKVWNMSISVGCADSIIISCTAGYRIKFNLLEKRWQRLPCETWDKDINFKSRSTYACLIDF